MMRVALFFLGSTHAVHTCIQITTDAAASSPLRAAAFDLVAGRIENARHVYRKGGDTGGDLFLYSVSDPERWVVGRDPLLSPATSHTGAAFVDSGASFPFLINARTRVGFWHHLDVKLEAPGSTWLEDETVAIRCGGWAKDAHAAPPAPEQDVFALEGDLPVRPEAAMSEGGTGAAAAHPFSDAITVASNRFPHLGGVYERLPDKLFEEMPVYFMDAGALYIFHFSAGGKWIVSTEVGSQDAIAYVEATDSVSRWFIGDGSAWHEANMGTDLR
jgi:hypothetical protein